MKWLPDCLFHRRYRGDGASKMFVIFQNNPAIMTMRPGVQSCECRQDLNFSLKLFYLPTKSALHYPLSYDYRTPSLHQAFRQVIEWSFETGINNFACHTLCLQLAICSLNTKLFLPGSFEVFWDLYPEPFLRALNPLCLSRLWHKGKSIIWKGKTDFVGEDYHQVLPNRIAAVVNSTSLPAGLHINKGKQCPRCGAPYRVQQCCREAS